MLEKLDWKTYTPLLLAWGMACGQTPPGETSSTDSTGASATQTTSTTSSSGTSAAGSSTVAGDSSSGVASSGSLSGGSSSGGSDGSDTTDGSDTDTGSGSDGTTGTSGARPTLACFRWNGQQEEVFTLDPTTGMATVFGTVGDLVWWNGSTAVDPQAGQIYVVGNNEVSDFLYVLDSVSGALLMSVPIPGPVQGLAIAPDGNLLHARWNGASEDLVRLDPATGFETVIGTVGDLAFWSGQTAIDAASETLYVLGNNNSDDKLWALDTNLGTLLDETITPGVIGTGLQLNQAGDLVYLRWSGSEEEVVRMDPATGMQTVIGIAGTLAYWSGTTALAPGSDSLYVFGWDAADDYWLWTVDAITGAVLDTAPLALDQAQGCQAW